MLFRPNLSCKSEERNRFMAPFCLPDWTPSCIRSVRATLLDCATRTAGTRPASWCHRAPSSPASTATPTAPRSRDAGYDDITNTLWFLMLERFWCIYHFMKDCFFVFFISLCFGKRLLLSSVWLTELSLSDSRISRCNSNVFIYQVNPDEQVSGRWFPLIGIDPGEGLN